MSTSTTTPPSVLTLPLLGTRGAPELFQGEYSRVRYFIDHYERLCAIHSVTSDQEKVEAILQYCSSQVRETIEGMTHFFIPDWDLLKADILKVYDASLAEQRFTDMHLRALITESHINPIRSLNDFQSYNRSFIRVGGWLKNKGKITEQEFNRYFWAGLPETFRSTIELRLLQQNPLLDVSKPFPYADVMKASEALLRRDRFDTDFLYTPNPLDPPPPFAPRSDVSIRPILPSPEARSTLQNLDRESTVAQKQDEVENLIKRLSRMSITEPDYSLLYYRAIKLDPDTAKVIRAPSLSSSPTSHPASATSTPSFPPTPQSRPARNITCFGCGKQGHGINDCEEINDLILKGQLSKDDSRRVTLANGQRIPRNFDEPILDAYKRLQPPPPPPAPVNHVRFITHATIEELDEDDEPIHAEESLVAAADHAQKSTREKRKEIFDGVVIPPRSKGKEKENQAPSSSIPVAPKLSNSIPTPTPFDTHRQSFDPINDDAIMEDATIPKPSKAADSADNAAKKPRPPVTTSSLSQSTNSKLIIERILTTPLTMSIGEVIGASRDISQQLQDLIRFKRQGFPPSAMSKFVDNETPHPSYLALTSSPLITVDFTCQGRRVTAIIDSGSTLNIVKEPIAKTIIRMPVMTSISMHMRDANGGMAKLSGLIEEVPLTCGGAETHANLFVAPQSDSGFDLLLGRPWMCGNGISIEERKNGTYIIFGTESHHPMELCVTAADHHHSHSHLITNSADILPQSYMITDDPDFESSPSEMTHSLPSLPSYVEPIQSSNNVNGDSSYVTDRLHSDPHPSRVNSPESSSASSLVFDNTAIPEFINRIRTWDPPIEEDPERVELRRLIREEERRSLLALLIGHDSHESLLHSIALSSEYSMSGPSGTDEHGNPFMDFLLFHSILIRRQRATSQHLVGSAYIRFHPTTLESPPPPSHPSLHLDDEPSPLPLTNGHLYLPRPPSPSLSYSPTEDAASQPLLEDDQSATTQTMLLLEDIRSSTPMVPDVPLSPRTSYPVSHIRWMQENMLTDADYDDHFTRNLPDHGIDPPELLYPEYADDDPATPLLHASADDAVTHPDASTSFHLPGPYCNVQLTRTETGWTASRNSPDASHDYTTNISSLADAINQARTHYPHPFEAISYPTDFSDHSEAQNEDTSITGSSSAANASYSESTASDFVMYSPLSADCFLFL
jgi:hypothetical protein